MSVLRRLIVSDEALMESPQELTAAGGTHMPPYERLVTLCRYTKTGFLGAAQALSPLPAILKSNVATVICLRCSSLKEAREAASMLGLPDERAREILHLPLGHGFVRSTGFDAPIKVWMPDFPLGDYLSDAQVSERLAAQKQHLAEETIYSAMGQEEAPPLDIAAILGEQPERVEPEPAVVDDATRARFLRDHRLLLQHICEHPDASVTQHYRNLSWSAWRGNRVKGQVLEMGLVRSERQKTANGRPCERLALTEKGQKLFDENIP